MAIRKDMGNYEPIKGADDCDLVNETAILINPDSVTLVSVSKHCNQSDEDVEMALRGSHSRSPLPIHNANPLTTPVSSKIDEPQFSSSVRPILRSSDQCHRLVSLDVFRGITVAVSIFCFSFSFSFFLPTIAFLLLLCFDFFFLLILFYSMLVFFF